MRIARTFALLALALALAGCSLLEPRSRHPRSLETWQQRAARQGLVLELPRFEQTPEELAASVEAAIAEADRRLDAIAAQDPERSTFASTLVALDDALDVVVTVLNRVYLVKEAHVDPAMREAATGQVEVLDRWLVGWTYREDVYRVVRAYADAVAGGRRPRPRGEDGRLLEDVLRDYRRAGMDLPPERRRELEELRNALNSRETRFDTNITETSQTLDFDFGELDGVPVEFLEARRQEDGRIAIRPTVTVEYLTVMQNARREEARRRLCTARYSLAQDVNCGLLAEMVRLRQRIAELLGYASWADYQVEPRMAGTAARAVEFVAGFVAALEPKFRAELEELRRLKVAQTGDPEAEIRIWDFRYYQNQLLKGRFQVDREALRNYFELERVLHGMFGVYEEVFGLRFHEVEAPAAWAPGLLRCFVCADAETGEPLGIFFLDLFPREGKYNHFAQFDIVGGKALPGGRYRRPVATLVCNFPPPEGDRPSLLAHEDVETFFHEFGHCLHTILTRARYARFAGANVEQDFVEAPSQMLENWVWDPAILARFAVDWRDPSKRLDMDVVRRMREADLATKGVYYRRQLAFALADLRMHTQADVQDPCALGNEVMAEISLAPPPGTAFCAYWGHLTGYDAGYYGYAWADAIAADLASAFEAAPERFLDQATGLRLRREIYEVGGARPATESVRAFLGRDFTHEAFVRSLGLEPAKTASRGAEGR